MIWFLETEDATPLCLFILKELRSFLSASYLVEFKPRKSVLWIIIKSRWFNTLHPIFLLLLMLYFGCGNCTSCYVETKSRVWQLVFPANLEFQTKELSNIPDHLCTQKETESKAKKKKNCCALWRRGFTVDIFFWMGHTGYAHSRRYIIPLLFSKQ